MATWTDTTSAPQYFSFIENNELCCAFFTAPWFVVTYCFLNSLARCMCWNSTLFIALLFQPSRCFRCKQVEEKINALPSNFPAVKLLKINIEDTEVESCPSCPRQAEFDLRDRYWLLRKQRLQINSFLIQDIASILEISTLPTFVLIKNGVEVHRVEGALQQRPARMVAQAIQKHLLQSYEN